MRGLLVAALLCGQAAADPPQEEAVRHFRRGSRSYSAGDFAVALREFKLAYELTPLPGLLFNLGQAARLNHQPDQARGYYQSYLRQAPEASNRDDVLRLVASCDRALSSERVGSIERPPPADRPPPEPVTHPELMAVPARPVERTLPRPMLSAGLAVGGIGLAALSAAIAVGVEADATATEVTRLAAEGAAWDPSYRSLYRQGEREAAAATALYAIGGAALATGMVLTIVGARHKRAPALAARAIGWRYDF